MTHAASPRIVHFGQARGETSTSSPKPDQLIAGDPKHTAQNFFSDPSGQLFAGIWESTKGKWRVRYTEHEFCHITAGQVRVESTTGESWLFKAGDSFVIPSGFDGVWDVIEPVRKLYVIFEPALT